MLVHATSIKDHALQLSGPRAADPASLQVHHPLQERGKTHPLHLHPRSNTALISCRAFASQLPESRPRSTLRAFAVDLGHQVQGTCITGAALQKALASETKRPTNTYP